MFKPVKVPLNQSMAWKIHEIPPATRLRRTRPSKPPTGRRGVALRGDTHPHDISKSDKLMMKYNRYIYISIYIYIYIYIIIYVCIYSDLDISIDDILLMMNFPLFMDLYGKFHSKFPDFLQTKSATNHRKEQRCPAPSKSQGSEVVSAEAVEGVKP